MEIVVTSCIAEGATQPAAFDSALLRAGIADYNLRPLSSVIPTGAVVVATPRQTPPDEYGHTPFLVRSRRDEAATGRSAWAGVGWVQDPRTARGQYSKQGGATEEVVRAAISTTIDQTVSERSGTYGPIQLVLVGACCRHRPESAPVAAAYRTEPWDV